MSRLVFDSSAILAVYYSEPGKKKAQTLIKESDPLISSVNLCEVFTKLLEDGLRIERITESFHALEIDVVNFDTNDAVRTADLRDKTKHLGLSLGDRACLAIAIHEDAIAVTADRSWQKFKGCRIELIR